MSASEKSGGGVDAPRQRAAWIDGDAAAEQSRIGEARWVKGGSKVVFAEDAPAAQRARPQGRSISEEEIARSGLLQERVIEIGEMREEAVVSKEAIVREELVVRRDVEQRTERIADTLRRTEVDVEPLEPKDAVEREAGDPSAR
ncbi:MAG: hypothetical protein QOJ91_1373 [Sphingomonadales bacterium]|jgi:hypothetical protein|nr:hypothetical protein [Sphingomonadales bacterium]